MFPPPAGDYAIKTMPLEILLPVSPRRYLPATMVFIVMPMAALTFPTAGLTPLPVMLTLAVSIESALVSRTPFGIPVAACVVVADL